MSRKQPNVRRAGFASTLPDDFAEKAQPGGGRAKHGTRRRPAKSKKIAATRERTFQAELARIRGTGVPDQLPKEKKLPKPQIIRPKTPPKRSLLDQVREGLRGKS